jgi:hypothetical protein
MSALVAIGRLGGYDDRRFAVACAHRWAPGVPLPRVVADIAASPGHFSAISLEMNGLGGPSSQMLTDALRRRERTAGGGEHPSGSVVIPAEDADAFIALERRRRAASQAFVTRKNHVHTTADMKAATYSALRMLVDQERLLIPAGAEDLIRELLLLRVDLTPGGVERIEAGSGHDDLADALMLATFPYRPRGTTRWRCYLADLVDPRSRLPVGMLPAAVDRLPTVQTVGGVEVPRRPVWQSVAGSELSFPAGVDLSPPKPPPDPRLAELRAAVQAVLDPTTTPPPHHEGGG